MNGGSRTTDEFRKYFPNTIQCLDQLIAEGVVTLESLLNVFNNLNGDAENKLNKNDPIRTVANEKQFGEELYGYLATTIRILDDNKKLINTLDDDIKAMVFEAQNAILDSRKAIKDIRSILKELEKNNDDLSKENKELQRLKDEEICLKKEQIQLNETNIKLKDEVGDNGQLKKINADLKKEQEKLLQQKNELIKNMQQMGQNRDCAKDEAHKLESENKNLEKEINKLEDTKAQLENMQAGYTLRIEKLENALKGLQKEEIEKKLYDLRSNAEILLGIWESFNKDTAVNEYFHESGDPEKDIINRHKQVENGINDIKECIEKQEKAYKIFLTEWEKKYK